MQTKNITRLLANDDICLIIQPQISKILGRSAATFLQQVHYWLTTQSSVGVVIDEQRWIYNTYSSWAQIIGMSESTVRRIIGKLESLGILLSQNLNKKKYDQTKWYSIDYETLMSIIPTVSLNRPNINASTLKNDSNSTPINKQKQLFKMNGSCVQNEQIINKETEITSETLNYKSEHPTQNFLQKLDAIDTNKSEQVEERGKNKLVLELIQIWNQTIEEGRDPILLTKKRAQYLAAAFQQKFNSSLEDWKIFCQKIASSQFLMGKVKETFRATLDWVLRFEVIQRIFEGDFGIAKSYKEKISLPDKRNIEINIESSEDSVAVKEIHKRILNQLGTAVYQAWFSKASVDFEGADSTILILPNRFVADYVATHFGFELRKLWTNVEIRCATF